MTMPPDPPRCEPPAEHRGERWHWLHWFGGYVPCHYHAGRYRIDGGWWEASELARLGYRWVAVAKPPEETKDA